MNSSSHASFLDLKKIASLDHANLLQSIAVSFLDGSFVTFWQFILLTVGKSLKEIEKGRIVWKQTPGYIRDILRPPTFY